MTGLNGFTSSVSVAIEGLPQGVTSSPVSPFSVAAGKSQQVTFSPGAMAAAGTASITLRGTSGSLTQSANLALTVTAMATPVCTLAASPAAIVSGQSSQLSWTTTNAVSATIDQGIGTVSLPSGSRTVSPAASTTYTMTVQNAASVSTNCQTGVTVSAPFTVGNGAITGVQFDSAIAQADRDYITKLMNDSASAMSQIFGSPADTFVLNVKAGSWSYDANTHTMLVGASPTAPGANQFGFDVVFLHELGGAYLLSSHFTAPGLPNWVSENMPDAVMFLVMRALGDAGVRPEITPLFVAELDYGIMALAGKEIVGGVDGKAWKGGGEATSLSDTSGFQLFLTLAATQSQATSRSWLEYTALKSLKDGLFAAANQKQSSPTFADLLAVARQVFTTPIDGMVAADWIAAQPIAYTYGKPGSYLFIRPVPAANPTMLSIIAFTRSSQEVAPGIPKETQASSGIITITISDANGAVKTVSFDLANTIQEITLDTTAYLTGGYRIQAQGTVDGVSVTAPDSYFGIYDRTLVPAGQPVALLDSALFLIGTNADGSISAKSFPALSGGSYLQDIAGAAVWKSNSTTIPASVTLLGSPKSLPLPLSRVLVVANP